MYDTKKYKGFLTSTVSWNDALKTSHNVVNNPISLQIEENIKKSAINFQLVKNLVNKTDELNGELQVNSWYRCEELNNHPEIKGGKTSGHLFGYAIDFRYTNNDKTKLKKLWTAIQNSNIPFHELYFEIKRATGWTWIHISFNPLFKRQIKELYV